MEHRDEIETQYPDDDVDNHNTTSKRDSLMSHVSQSSNGLSEDLNQISDELTIIPYGFQMKSLYEHKMKNTDIMGVTYNSRMRQFIIIDSKCVTLWKREASAGSVHTAFTYNKYEYRVITHMIYARKYNCYFALGKEFSLQVYNKDFEETCSVSCDLRSVLFMLFNEARDELITGGVAGMKIWTFHQAADKMLQEIKPLANYRLTLRAELKNVGGSWVKKVELEPDLQHLYCCSETDLYAYNMNGSLLFKFENAHAMSITGCRYSHKARLLVTSSVDTEVKVWSMLGGLVHTFRGHSKSVTNVEIHPGNSSLVITSSADGSLKLWSLDTMDMLYTITVSPDGVQWMGVTDDKYLYVSTRREVSLWALNTFYEYWGLARTRLVTLTLASAENKSTRVVSLGADNSVRLFSRRSRKNLCTVLPPPDLSPMEAILGMAASRKYRVVYLLLNPREVWLYTTRTDPACRVAVWNLSAIQKSYNKKRLTNVNMGIVASDDSQGTSSSKVPSHKCTQYGQGSESVSDCVCIAFLDSNAVMWTAEGYCSPLQQSYLLLGLEDGRVLFMDPVSPGLKHMEFTASRDTIVSMWHDKSNQELMILSKFNDILSIQTWSLPYLTLVSVVLCARDMLHYTRLGGVLFTGHADGSVIRHILVTTTDPETHKSTSRVLDQGQIMDKHRRADHPEAVVALDSCPAASIIVSASSDGTIKIWDSSKVLLTEIMLDNSVSCACFLNSQPDLLVGFKNHIFIITADKIYPNRRRDEQDSDSGCEDSDVYEEPSVRYEGLQYHSENPTTLQTYLVPFKMKFSDEFLNGKHAGNIPLDHQSDNEDECRESQASQAPTDIYRSPVESPRQLSAVDHLIRSKVTKNDLDDQMPLTEQMLIDKVRKKRERMDDDVPAAPAGDPICFPQFGRSPGPSPTLSLGSRKSSRASSSLSSAKDDASESEMADCDSEPDEDRQTPQTTKRDTVETYEHPHPEFSGTKNSKEFGGVPPRSLDTKKTASSHAKRPGLNEITVDVESLMKAASTKRRTKPRLKSTDRSHVLELAAKMIADAPVDRTTKKKRRETLKKQPISIADRKHPSRGSRSAGSQRSTRRQGHMKQHTDSGECLKQALVNCDEHPISTKDDTISNLIDSAEIRGSSLVTQATDGTDAIFTQNSSKTEIVKDISSAKSMQPDSFNDSFSLQTVSHFDSGCHTPGKMIQLTDCVNLTEIIQPSSHDSLKSADMTDSGIDLVNSDSHGSLSETVKSAGCIEINCNTSKGITTEKFQDRLPVSRQKNLAVLGSLGESANETDEDNGLDIMLPRVTINQSRCDSLVMEDDGLSALTDHSEANFATTNKEHKEPKSRIIDYEIPKRFSELLTAVRDKRRLLHAGLPKRPITASVHQSKSIKDMNYLKRRPHTAFNLSSQDLNAEFSSALQRYSSLSCQSGQVNLYQNSGTNFEDNWRERMVERYWLLKTQRQLRAQSAAERREVLDKHRETRSTRPATTAGRRIRPIQITQRRPKDVDKTAQSQPGISSMDQGSLPLMDKSSLAAQQPFRCRMTGERSVSPIIDAADAPSVKATMFDPRNKPTVPPTPTRSIPSKCRQYFLISRGMDASAGVIPTTPLERRLLFERFPNSVPRLLPSYHKITPN